MRALSRAYSLVEVIVASFVLVVGLVPILSMVTTASSEVVKARDRTTALALAMSVAEEMRSRRVADRATVPTTNPQALAHLKPLVDAYKADRPEWSAGVDRSLSNFRCAARMVTGTPNPTVKVEVDWAEAGTARQYALESVVGAP